MAKIIKSFSPNWTESEVKFLKSLKTPEKIQKFLDNLQYSKNDYTQSARNAIKTKTAHCFDGAIVAAAALEQNGYPPLIIDLRAVEDDDHILAIFKAHNCFGALAKSNYSGLRYREPVYRTLRELVMSYFENYFNLSGKRTLREFSVLYDLRKEKKINWRTSPDPIDELGELIDATKHYRVISKAAEKNLIKLDKRSLLAGKIGRRV
jgi:hypothetical protein